MNEQMPLPSEQTPSSASSSAQPTAKKIIYTVREAVFAILSLIFGYFFIDTLVFSDSSGPGLGAALLVYAFAALVLVYQIISKQSFSVRGIVCLVLLIATGTSLLLFDTGALRVYTLLFDMALGLFWLFISLGASTSERLDYLAWFDAIKAFFILPFSCFGHTFTAMFGGFSRKTGAEKSEKNHRILYIVIGVLIAVIPCSIVIGELSGDEAFKTLLDNLFSFEWLSFRPGEIIAKLLLAVPVGCYLFGALFGATRRQRKNIFTHESAHKAAKAVRFIPLLIVCTVITPLLIIYLLYFFSQTAYFISAFSNILPEGFTYAEYARSGFFELCRVSVVNLIVIAVAEIFSRYCDKKPPALKIYNTLLSVFTLALMVIAQSKMIMYIRTYGMTPKRVVSFWFTILVGVLFIFILLYQFLPKINFTRCAAVSFAVLFCALIFANTDAIVARYNIDMYLNGEAKTLDTDMLLYELSDSVTPVILEKFDDLPVGNERYAIARFYTQEAKLRREPRTDDWRSFNCARTRADKLIVEKFSHSGQ